MKGKDLLSISDLSAEDIKQLISRANNMKHEEISPLLQGEVLALLFEKPSLRTRVSFEVAMQQLGGQSLYLSPEEVGLGKRESIPDVARVLSRYVDGIVVRTFSQQTLELLAKYATVPVFNALSDREHPCQALADLLTIFEKKGGLQDITLAFVGDGNNVAHSLMLAASLVGMNFRIASPKGYGVKEEVIKLAQDMASRSSSQIISSDDPQAMVKEADVVYTDVWTSMGQETEAEERRRIFTRYQVDSKLIALAKEDALLMHPLPAHRGEEITDEVMESARSVVFDQAENRLHLQRALLAEVMGN